MIRPPYGIHLPCRLRHVRDADTIVVTITGSYEWAIRLDECWAPEKHTPEGKLASRFAKSLLEKAENLSVWVKLPESMVSKVKSGQPINLLLEIATFDRMVGVIFLGDGKTLNEALVEAGYATKEKQ